MSKLLIGLCVAMFCVGACGTSACGGASVPGTVAAVVDCLGDNSDAVAATVRELDREPIDWDVVTAKAVDAGLAIGGCAFAILVDRHIRSTTTAASLSMVADTWSARRAFEHYRSAHAAGAKFRTAVGDL